MDLRATTGVAVGLRTFTVKVLSLVDAIKGVADTLTQLIQSATAGEAPAHPGLRRATPDTIGDVLDLHRRIAEL